MGRLTSRFVAPRGVAILSCIRHASTVQEGALRGFRDLIALIALRIGLSYFLWGPHGHACLLVNLRLKLYICFPLVFDVRLNTYWNCCTWRYLHVEESCISTFSDQQHPRMYERQGWPAEQKETPRVEPALLLQHVGS